MYVIIDSIYSGALSILVTDFPQSPRTRLPFLLRHSSLWNALKPVLFSCFIYFSSLVVWNLTICIDMSIIITSQDVEM